MAAQGKFTMSSKEPVTDTTGTLSGCNTALMDNLKVNFYLHGENTAACQNIMVESSPFENFKHGTRWSIK
eukprot:8610933-Ditylum_brightwellii.AAC.1